MNIVNTTDYDIKILNTNNEIVSLKPNRDIKVRLNERNNLYTTTICDNNSNSFNATILESPYLEGLPEEKPDTIYIIDSDIAEIIYEKSKRNDLYICSEYSSILWAYKSLSKI